MTFLITVFAAVTATVIWYRGLPQDTMKLGALSLIYWGAALMWLADLCFEYAEIGTEVFYPAPNDMLNDAFLGLYVSALGLVIWLCCLLLKDPEENVKKYILRRN